MFEEFLSWITSSTVATAAKNIATDAAIGAVVGGVSSSISGGKFSDGAIKGAITGGVIGGIQSAFPSTDIETVDTSPSAPSSPGAPESNESELSRASGVSIDKTDDSSLAANDKNVVGNGGGLLGGLKNTFTNMSPASGQFYGKLLSGVGQGLLSMQQAKDKQAQDDLDYERRKSKVSSATQGMLGRIKPPTFSRSSI